MAPRGALRVVKTLRGIAALRRLLAGWRAGGERIALVPTMGNLHAGHLALVALARRHAPRVVVSVFVNPAQFGPGEDYARYPRTLASDRRQLVAAGADVLFVPAVTAIYPGGSEATTTVAVPGLSAILCGQSRPRHFAGVTSVVARLFNIVQPDVAVFGRKDYQQLVIIRRMAADLHFPVRVIAGTTRRERDGLALSSRNQYLSARERAHAPALHAALSRCREALRRGRRDFAALEADGLAALRVAGMKPDYFAIRRAADLAAPERGDRALVVLAAAYLGRARLIDNVRV